jgi:hypothetical protein
MMCLALICLITAKAQNKTLIAGIVKDPDGQAIPIHKQSSTLLVSTLAISFVCISNVCVVFVNKREDTPKKSIFPAAPEEENTRKLVLL